MLRLNVTQEKQLTFEVQIGGVQHDQVSSQFKIIINEVEYGFPAKVGRETITVNLPPLNKVVAGKIVEGDEAEVKLEIIADGHYLTPWQDRASLSNPLIVEAKIKDTSFIPNPSFETKLVVEEDGAKQTTIIEKKEELTPDQKIENISSKLEQLIEMQEQSDLPPSPEKEEEEEEVEEKCSVTKEEKEEKEEKEDDKSETVEELLNKEIDKLQLNEKKKMALKEFKQNLTKEDVLRYIEKKGSKNPEVQKLIYEQAKTAAQKDSPAHILKEVAIILKK